MYRELDMIILEKALPLHGLNRGAVGTIIMLNSKRSGYQVEFVAPEGKKNTIVSLKSCDFRAVD